MSYVIPFTGFGIVHQYVTIPAGGSAVVLRFNIPDGCVGFLKLVGNNWWSNTHYRWVIDGEVIELRVERMIGSPQNPRKIDPPYVVKDYIEFMGYNDDERAREFEVIIDGEIHMKRPSFEVL